VAPLVRLLAGFEPDPHRACVTHRHRAKLLGPLEGQLSLVHFLGLVRSLHLELGNVARSIHEIKEAAGWPAAKVREGAGSARGACVSCKDRGMPEAPVARVKALQ
jgi:hypothetical protein